MQLIERVDNAHKKATPMVTISTHEKIPKKSEGLKSTGTFENKKSSESEKKELLCR